MKISKSKHQLAQLLIEAGVKQLPEGANWAAQDASGLIYCYTDKPDLAARAECWIGESIALIANSEVIVNNWCQTVLSRAEFDQIVAESAEQGKPDADGWIEWKGGECPVDGDLDVSVKFWGEDDIGTGKAKSWSWRHCGAIDDIVAYRLHKPEHDEPQCCESVPRSIPESIAAPTLDQLLQDYRNAADFAAAKQAEADEAAKMRDERWKAAQARASELGVSISIELVVDAEMHESELVITDWQDLQLGDEIEVIESNQSRCNGMIGIVSRFDEADHQQPIRVIFDGNERDYDWPTKWRFIRRP